VYCDVKGNFRSYDFLLGIVPPPNLWLRWAESSVRVYLELPVNIAAVALFRYSSGRGFRRSFPIKPLGEPETLVPREIVLTKIILDITVERAGGHLASPLVVDSAETEMSRHIQIPHDGVTECLGLSKELDLRLAALLAI